MSKPINEWSVEDVAAWLDEVGLSSYKDLLCYQHQIDGPVLISLTEEDLRKPPVQMKILGDIKRLSLKIYELCASVDDTVLDSCYKNRFNSRLSSPQHRRKDASPEEEDDALSFCTDRPDGTDPRRLSPLEEEIRSAIISEGFRTFISVCYAFSVFLFASFVLAVVHDRLPDVNSYPPLPDVFLENIPVMPWAFALCEICASTLLSFWCFIIIFHKYRLVVLRRSCAIAGTIFLLRCFTMYVTSLSVPGKHLQCTPTKYGTFWNRLNRAFEIFIGGGLSINGVRTCGDYMFSGHTASLTILNLFVIEYTPRRWHMLHTFCWMLNVFGVFFILASHEHYSIDVLISFYISSRLFMYYHTLASTVQVRTCDEIRRRTWFPMFWFFEYGCPLVIPNEFEWPFTLAKVKQCFWWVGRRKSMTQHPETKKGM